MAQPAQCLDWPHLDNEECIVLKCLNVIRPTECCFEIVKVLTDDTSADRPMTEDYEETVYEVKKEKMLELLTGLVGKVCPELCLPCSIW